MTRRANRPRAAAPAPPRSERARACRRLVRRRALRAAGVSALPVLGVDLFVNAHLLAQTVDEINHAYGLSPAQIAALPSVQRSRVDELARKVGSYLIGRVATQAALIAALRAIGLRLGAQQAAKAAPVVGLAASAALSGWLFMRLCDRHIAHCEQVRAALLALPAPEFAPVIDV
jgi:predicted XRE-type DNA-binding protein